jgi:hypothetical protein
MPRTAVLASSARACAVDAQQRPALVAASARLDRANLGQVVVEGLGEINLGLVERGIFETARPSPIVGRACGPKRAASRPSGTVDVLSCLSVVDVVISIVFVPVLV